MPKDYNADIDAAFKAKYGVGKQPDTGKDEKKQNKPKGTKPKQDQG